MASVRACILVQHASFLHHSEMLEMPCGGLMMSSFTTPDTTAMALSSTGSTFCAFQMPRKSMLSRSEEHTSELQSLMRISYAVFCLKKQHRHHRSQLSMYVAKH